MEWQTIDSAPRDGTVIVAYDPNTGTSHVTWWDRTWYDPDHHYYSETEDFVPQYWMPLPTPPVDDTDKLG